MHTSVSRALGVVNRWHAAANEAEDTELIALASPDIELIGPRGTNRGHQVLRDWLQRAGLSYVPLRWFAGEDGAVVVEERVAWHDPQTAEALDEAVVASRFRVRDGKVISYARHPDLREALDAAGLSMADEVTAPG